VIDTLRPVTLPEGVEISLRLAGPLARSRAWVIDLALRMVAMMLLPLLFGAFGRTGQGISTIVGFAIWIVYPIPFEVLWNGATPGKRACNLAVVRADGTPVGWAASLLRNVMRFADVLPIGYLVGFVAMMLDGQMRRLGDIAAGTVVIHVPPAAKTVQAPAAMQPVLPAFALTPLEQRAVVDYADRRGTWSRERAAEIAQLAGPLVEGLHGDEAAERVSAVAAALVRQR
jgi:uncharacterized RDD family membrane protein YckC